MDLETPDAELEDLIIKEYSGTIFGDQHSIEKTEDGKLYKFSKLRIIPLFKLLNESAQAYSYIVIKTTDKTVLMQRKVTRFEYSLN